MTGVELHEQVVGDFRSQGGRFGLDAGSQRAERMLNRGRFISHSDRVEDGERSVPAKLATVAYFRGRREMNSMMMPPLGSWTY
jgi:hypothetical protein